VKWRPRRRVFASNLYFLSFFITCRLLGVCFRVLKVIVGRVCRWSLFVVDVGCRGCRVSLPLVVVVGYWLSDVGFRLLVVDSLCWLVVVAQIFLVVSSFFIPISVYCQKKHFITKLCKTLPHPQQGGKDKVPVFYYDSHATLPAKEVRPLRPPQPPD